MFIQGIGTATPPGRYLQTECWEILKETETYARLTERSRSLMQKVLTGDSGITARHLVLGDLSEAFALDPDTLHKRFLAHAPQLGAQAAAEALRAAGVTAKEIDAVIVSTCTGYVCPGLSSYLTQLLGLRADVLGFDLVGQGCGAALPNLVAAEALLSSGRCDRILSVCVEVCSAALYIDNDPGVLISACLFGDGAGAVVLGRDPGSQHPRIEWVCSESFVSPEDRDLLRFEQRGGMLRNILNLRVPSLAGKHVGNLIERLLTKSELKQEQVASWILHPGGRDVLVALSKRLQLEDGALAASAAVLREYGNLSSPSVFFVLKEALKRAPQDGYWILSSFGAGFSCYAAVLEVQQKPCVETSAPKLKTDAAETCERVAG